MTKRTWKHVEGTPVQPLKQGHMKVSNDGYIIRRDWGPEAETWLTLFAPGATRASHSRGLHNMKGVDEAIRGGGCPVSHPWPFEFRVPVVVDGKLVSETPVKPPSQTPA